MGGGGGGGGGALEGGVQGGRMGGGIGGAWGGGGGGSARVGWPPPPLHPLLSRSEPLPIVEHLLLSVTEAGLLLGNLLWSSS